MELLHGFYGLLGCLYHRFVNLDALRFRLA